MTHQTIQAPGAPRLPLHAKIAVLLAVLLAGCMVLFSFVTYTSSRGARQRLADAEMRRTASHIASLSTQDQSPDWARVQNFVRGTMSLYTREGASELLELVYIVIEDDSGTPRAYAFNHALMGSNGIRITNSAGEPVDEKNFEASARDVDLGAVSAAGLTHLSMDIAVNGRARGTVKMGYLVKNLARQEQTIFLQSLAVLCGLLAFGVILAIFLSRHLTRPILEVVQGMDLVAHGDLSARAHSQNRDETALLVQGFNHMAAHLEESRTALHEKSRELAESELKYRSVVDNANDGIGILQAGCLRFVNARFAEIADEPADTITGTPFIQFVAPDERPRFTKILDRFINDSARRQLVETVLVRPGGETVSVEINITAITWNGAPAGLVCVRDITERKNAETERQALQEQLLQSQKMEAVGTLAGGMAHDFNNLLAVIMGIADLALVNGDPESKDYANYQKIVDIARKAKDLTTRLLTFVRKDKLNIETVDISLVTGELADLLRRTLPRKITVVNRSAGCPLPVKMDANQVQQALLNICINAGDAMPDGGQIIIEARLAALDDIPATLGAVLPADRTCLVEIRDSGPGVPEEIRTRIFDPFFTTKGRGKGTGLGLFTSMGIIRNHGGELYADQAPEGGCAFRVLLPLAPDSGEMRVVETARARALAPGKQSETILVIDDEPDVLAMAREALSLIGYSVLSADSGARGIEVFRENAHRINLVILDMIMPDMDGAQVFRALREISSKAPVSLCSGYSDDGDAAALIEQGALGFLQKPFDISGLSAFVRAKLDAQA